MQKTRCFFIVLTVTINLLFLKVNIVCGQHTTETEPKDSTELQDTTFVHGELDSLLQKNNSTFLNRSSGVSNIFLDMKTLSKLPLISLQQISKGEASGLYAQESSGEPGTQQWMFIRGLSAPLISNALLYGSQPAVYLNGIPIAQDNAYVYNVENYNNNPIGTATNVLSAINPEDIQSIEVLKNASDLGVIGPNASNGAIWITTKQAKSGKKNLTVNSYYGIAQRPSITPINAAWENQFRQTFYNKYATEEQKLQVPAYLNDSTDAAYYGPANWVEDYYRNAPTHSIDMSLTGGSNRANILFAANNTRSAGVGDGTYLDRYGVNFMINMAPLKALTFSAMMNGNRLIRKRDKSITDRVAETGYLPDMSNPLAPNKNEYDTYLSYFDQAIDNNRNDILHGYVSASLNFSKFSLTSKIGFDYNENIRDVFIPSTLMDGNNYLSSYSGYNQRFIVSNIAKYEIDLSSDHTISVEAGQSMQYDKYKYDYFYGFNTANDFIKINTDTTGTTGLSPYLFRFTDKEQFALSSVYGHLSYSGFDRILNVGVTIRNDGSSAYQTSNRWYFSPEFDLSYDVKRSANIKSDNAISRLLLRGSWGRIGKLLNDNMFAVGPQYVADPGWGNEHDISSYRGMAVLSRPYQNGWVGYDYPWAYSEKRNIGIDIGIWKDRIILSAEWYSDIDNNQIIAVPAPQESGYTSRYVSGLKVRNTGIDLNLLAAILKNEKGFSWSLNANANFNKNEILALPGNVPSIEGEDYKLQVGKPVDAFWVFENTGAYQASATGQAASFEGVSFSDGDAMWKDVNGDGVIDNSDKVLKGHYMPTISGGFGSNLSYKNFSLNVDFYYALGRSVLNTYVSNRLNFIKVEEANDISSVKEITFWKKPFNPSDYPVYNPWSNIENYRQDQDLFLQKASFLKLKDILLSYDFKDMKWFRNTFNHIQLYASATNVFTVSPFKNGDPELSSYNGIYDGSGMDIPRTYTIGVKLDF